MTVVADSSVLIGLASIGRLELLHALFGPVAVPEAVYREVVEDGGRRSGARAVAQAPWIERRRVGDAGAADLLAVDLDRGEAEAIVLAREVGARWLVDNREPRIIARRLGLAVVGTVGVLVESRRRELIPSCRAALAELVAAGFWVSPDVVAAAVRAAGEEAE